MKDFTVNVKMPRYLAQWLTYCLGNPVRFPAHSHVNLVLRHYLTKPPKEQTTRLLKTHDEVPVVIPDNALKRPEYYNYLGRAGMIAVKKAAEELFRMNLWSECSPLMFSSYELNRGLDEWCEAHGIELDYREAVRQKFYRMRKEYAEHHIVLGKFYKKKEKSLPR